MSAVHTWTQLFKYVPGETNVEVEVEVHLRPTVSVGQSILVSGTHLGPATNFSFSLKFPLDSYKFAIL
jgi:hypothetical protein